MCRSPSSLITTGQSQQTNKQKELLLLLLLWYPSGKNGPQSCYFPNPDHQARIVCMYVDSKYVCMYVCRLKVCMYVCMYVAPESKTIIACYSNNPCKKWALLFHNTSEWACDHTDKWASLLTTYLSTQVSPLTFFQYMPLSILQLKMIFIPIVVI